MYFVDRYDRAGLGVRGSPNDMVIGSQKPAVACAYGVNSMVR